MFGTIAASTSVILTPDGTWILILFRSKNSDAGGIKITNTAPMKTDVGAATSSVITIPSVDFGTEGYAQAVLSLAYPLIQWYVGENHAHARRSV